MKKSTLSFFFTLISVYSFTQIRFEKGYFITNNEEKIECLIRNVDWEFNPTKFRFKTNESGEVQTKSIEEVKEFGILKFSKYVRATVQIDRSSNDINDLSRQRPPEFSEEQIFLKLLAEGAANLYVFNDKKITRFFFNKEGAEIQQLIFKTYQTTDRNIRENVQFRQQINNELKCQNIHPNVVEHLGYYEKPLKKIFDRYNECVNPKAKSEDFKKNSTYFNFSVRPGINRSHLNMDSGISKLLSADYDSELNFRMGFEAELVLPFLRNKWAILFEPTYQSYRSEIEVPVYGTGIAIYKSIELPVGLRHYFYLENSISIFLNAVYIFDFPHSSAISYENGSIYLRASHSTNFGLGVGVKYKNRFGLEFRYYGNRDILTDYITWSAHYDAYSLILGVRLF